MKMNGLLFGIGAGTALLFVVLGWAVRYRKAYWLISGYNMMSDEQKRRVDAEGLAKMLFRWLMAGAAILFAAFALLALGQVIAGMGVFALIVLWIVGLIAQAQRFDANARDTHGRWTPKTRWLVGSVAAGVLLVAGFVGWMIYRSDQPVEYALADGELDIQCVFGTTVALSELSDLQLLDGLPPIAMRTNGAATGSRFKGSFTLEGGGSARIYARTDATAVVRFLRGRTVYLLSGETAEQTRQLYRDLGGQ